MTTLTERPATTERLATLTLAHALLGLILLCAAILRLAQLAALPLSPAEAREALAAYSVWEPARSATAPIGSPLYFALTALLKPLGRDSDGLMRLVPALFGLGSVYLPWLLRREIGTVGALLAAALLAVAPTQVALARTAGGDAAALFAVLLLAVAWLHLSAADGDASSSDPSANNRWLIAAAVALALGLASSALFYTGLTALAIAGLLTGLGRPRLTAAPQAALLALVLFVLLSTLALTQPAGLGAAANLAATWLGQFGVSGALLRFAPAVLRYETAIVVLGLPALIAALWLRGGTTERLLLFWTLTTLLLALAQDGALNGIALLTFPVYLLLARALDRLVTQGLTWYSGLTFLLGSIWGIIALVNIGRYTRLDARDIFPLLVTVLILLAFSFLVVTVVPEIRAALQGVALSALLIWAFVGWGTATSLTRLTGNDPRELWVSEAATDSDLRLLRRTLQQSSFQLDRSINGLPIVSAVDDPSLRWYLRDFTNVSWATVILPGTSSAAVIMPFNAETPDLAGSYISAPFDYRRYAATDAPAVSFTGQLQWWFFRDSDQPTAGDRLLLWLRTDR